MFTDCFMFLNTQNYKFRLQEVYFCKSSFLHHRIYIFVPHWFIFTLLTFTFFAVPFFSFTFVSAQKSKRIMCVIDQPARALYHHSIGKSDESQPEDTPHQQPPSAATIIGEEVPKKNGRPPSGPTLSTVSTESRPTPIEVPGHQHTNTGRGIHATSRPNTAPPSVRITGLSSTELRSGTRKPAPVPSMPPTSLPHNPPPQQPSTHLPQKKSHQHERPRTKDHGALSSHADAVCQRTCRSPRHHLQYL